MSPSLDGISHSEAHRHTLGGGWAQREHPQAQSNEAGWQHPCRGRWLTSMAKWLTSMEVSGPQVWKRVSTSMTSTETFSPTQYPSRPYPLASPPYLARSKGSSLSEYSNLISASFGCMHKEGLLSLNFNISCHHNSRLHLLDLSKRCLPGCLWDSPDYLTN